jgi:hypothetical protein
VVRILRNRLSDITFTPEGVLYFEGANQFDCYTVDGDKLEFNIGASDDSPVLTVKFDGADKMTTTGPGGDRVYKRLNSTGTLSEEANILKIEKALDGGDQPTCPAP